MSETKCKWCGITINKVVQFMGSKMIWVHPDGFVQCDGRKSENIAEPTTDCDNSDRPDEITGLRKQLTRLESENAALKLVVMRADKFCIHLYGIRELEAEIVTLKQTHPDIFTPSPEMGLHKP